MTDQQIQIPSGLVCVTTYGPIRHETAECLMNLRSHTEAQGVRNVRYVMMNGILVEKTRNEAARMCLRDGFGWLMFIDGDCTFPADALVATPPNGRPGLLQTAFGSMPQADILGGWCPLRGELSLPTLDTGTGTWESIFPGSGVLEVMRTGGAFVLVKRHCFERTADPWYRMRVPSRPIHFMAEVDNWARMKWNGENPFRNLPDSPWEKLERAAQDDPAAAPEQFVPIECGEDSAACDKFRNAGLRIFVDTNVVCGHVDHVVRSWGDHKTAMDKMAQQERYASGLLA